MAEVAELEVMIASLRAQPAAGRAASDEELLADAEAWEAVGRLADARRAAVACEVARRSHPQLGITGLAFRHGDRSAVDLLTRHLRISGKEATKRIAIGGPLAPRAALSGEELPGRFPIVAEAVREGAIALDAARIITDTLTAARRRASAEDLAIAECGLTEAARDTDPDLLRIHAAAWAMRIDQDGARPAEEESPLHGRHVASRRVGTGSVGPAAAAVTPDRQDGRARHHPGQRQGERRGPRRPEGRTAGASPRRDVHAGGRG